jgi:predicted phosphodiesterase
VNDDDLEEKLYSKILKLETAKHNQKLENDRLKRKLAKYERDEERAAAADRVIDATLRAKVTKIPTWRMPPVKRRKKRAWAVQMLSDLHLGEVQNMSEIGNYNSYNAKIAEMRLKHTVISSIREFKTYTANIEYDGLCLPIAGDVLTGEIHEELTKTNSETVTETIVKWVPKLASAIQLYVDEFGDTPNGVFVPCVTGNHDRRGKKLEHKNAARDSYSWILYHWLADYFKDNPKVTFYIPNSLDARFNLYNTRFLLTHGYGMSGGGAAGAVGAVMNDRQRLAIRDNVIGEDFDYLLCGHLHQTVFAQGGIMSGCMKGFDTYAYDIKCKPEEPSQALFLVTPERGITKRMPIFCEAPGEREFWT